MGWAAVMLYYGEKARRNGMIGRRKIFGNQYRESGYTQVFRSEQPGMFWFLTGINYFIGVGGLLTGLYYIFFLM